MFDTGEKELTTANIVGTAVANDAIQVDMITIRACRFVHKDRAFSGYRIAINLKTFVILTLQKV